MEKIVKLYLSQTIWFITALVSCFVGLGALGLTLFNDLVVDVTLPISFIVGLAGFIGMIMFFIDEPDYCRLEK
jgi:hypothetical protein